MIIPGPTPDQQILRSAAATLSWQPTDALGEPTAPAGAVTIGVTKADGTVVVAAGTATVGTGSSPRTYSLAAVNTLELLTVTWTDTGDGSTATQLVEVVGGFWFSVAQARVVDKNLTDTTIYPTERILAVRAEVEHEFERITRAAWVPRYRRVRVSGTGHESVVVPDRLIRAVRSVRVYDSDNTSYSTFAAAEIAGIEATRHGRLWRRDGGVWETGDRNIAIEYEHGNDAPPADLRTAAVRMLRHRLNADKSGVPDRAESFVNDAGGRFVISTPGLRGAITGIPDVDVVLNGYTLPDPGFGA